MFSEDLVIKTQKLLLEHQASLMQADNYPIYRRGKKSKVVVRFTDIKTGYVIDPGTTNHKIGSFHSDWIPYYDATYWDTSYTYVDPEATPPKTPDQLVLFETTHINSTTTITKVPNGYVMTSHSGHQVLIPTNSI